jgi:hypothetical protein
MCSMHVQHLEAAESATHSAGVVVNPHDARHRHVGHEVGIGRSAPARGMPLQLPTAATVGCCSFLFSLHVHCHRGLIAFCVNITLGVA